MWVYVYKFNKHGRFVKCKARLVVRGDQEAKNITEDTFASTLAGKSFRTLIAIAARFNLELIQYDAVNAFVNASLKEAVFMKMPPGQRVAGMILILHKALYGLRKSPLLWQQDFTSTLEKLKWKRVPHEPCCYIRDGVLIFFYVDDIVIAYRKSQQAIADELIQGIRDQYQLSGGDELQWFLGIEVIRNRKEGRIWLCQSAYIEKIAKLAETNLAYTTTPMATTEILPYEGLAEASSITRYQRKLGSILFAAVNTRPDIAFATSRLARFNTNPAPEHHLAADRILRYLYNTKSLGLQFGGKDTFDVASDASFADNSTDRKSSQAFVMRLFGGVIGWRANKQATVSTSTTEAELLALSQAAKESYYTRRLLKELSVELEDPVVRIECDNLQTIRLVTERKHLFHTALKHVDVHNHWLREEHAAQRLEVHYVPTNQQIADGLTKALPRQKYPEFLKQLGLTDIQPLLEARRLKELKEEDFNTT
jgi:hypothetical protein